MATPRPLGAYGLVQVQSQSPPPKLPSPAQPSGGIYERQVANVGGASSGVIDSVCACLGLPPSDSSPFNSGVRSAAMAEHFSLNVTSMWHFFYPFHSPVTPGLLGVTFSMPSRLLPVCSVLPFATTVQPADAINKHLLIAIGMDAPIAKFAFPALQRSTGPFSNR